MLGGLLAVSRIVAAKQYPAMNFWVQGFDPSAKHFGPASQLGNIAHRNSSLAQQARRAPGRNDFDAERGELPRKIGKAAFVKHT